MACQNDRCSCAAERTTRNGGSYCSEDCANRAEESARAQSQPLRAGARVRDEGCGCGHAGCTG